MEMATFKSIASFSGIFFNYIPDIKIKISLVK